MESATTRWPTLNPCSLRDPGHHIFLLPVELRRSPRGLKAKGIAGCLRTEYAKNFGSLFRYGINPL
jgi:hypothetical protein